MLHSKEGSRGLRGDGNLGVDVLDMVVDGLLRDSEKPANLLLGVSTVRAVAGPPPRAR